MTAVGSSAPPRTKEEERNGQETGELTLEHDI